MTNKDLYRVFGSIDPKMVEAAAPMENRGRTAEKKAFRWVPVAACFCLLLAVCIPFLLHIFKETHDEGPVAIEYDTVEQMNDALDRDTFYSTERIMSNGGEIDWIAVSYARDDKGNAVLEQPWQALIGQNLDDCRIHYYVIFNRTDVNDSYIAGYVEQNLSVTINGIEIRYSNHERKGTHEGQAKFVRNGDLYVVHVFSGDKQVDIVSIIENLFG